MTPRWSALVASIVPVAAFATIDPAGWYPFGPAKWFAVSVVVAAAAAVVFADGELRLPRAATAWWGGLLAWLAVATVAAVDPYLAWIGTAERHLGWYTWLLFFAMFAVGCQLTRRTEVDVVANGAVVASLFGGGYAIVELVAGRPVAIDVATTRLGGSFGSAAYLGAAAVLVVPVCAGVATDVRTSRSWRSAGAGGGVLMAVALVGSGSRAAWVGIAAAGAVAVVRLVGARRFVVLGGAALVALLAVLAVAPRLDDVTDRSAPAASRVDEWSLAGRVIASAPLVGVGPEGYRVAVVGEIGADYERTYGRDVSPDRAHSGPLDVAAIGGVPAAVAYLVLLTVVGRSAVRAVWRRRPVVAGLGAGVLAYLVQQLFLFPVAELDVVLWLFAGIVVAADRPPAWTVNGRAVRFGWASVAALAAVVLFVGGLLGVAADRAAREAVRAGVGPVAIERARRAADLRPDAVRHHLLVAQLEERTGTLAGTDAAIAAADDALRWSPRDPIALRAHAAYVSRRAEITGKPADVRLALDAWLDVVDADPNCWRCQLALGFAAAQADDTALARQAWERAAILADDTRAADLLGELDRVDG